MNQKQLRHYREAETTKQRRAAEVSQLKTAAGDQNQRCREEIHQFQLLFLKVFKLYTFFFPSLNFSNLPSERL